MVEPSARQDVTAAAGRLSLAEIEQYLAKAADLLRGNIDQADFKAYIFPLMFFKRISDMYLEEFEAASIKEVIAWQIEQAMKAKKLSKNKMADLMKTSRAQLDRLLDPERGNVTIETLQRAANVLGRSLRIELA